ncbi:hypothetical protein ACE6H2_026893 [Prunus campanulata]
MDDRRDPIPPSHIRLSLSLSFSNLEANQEKDCTVLILLLPIKKKIIRSKNLQSQPSICYLLNFILVCLGW